jgi:tetratricopeptide (TPR) repeat protein
MQEPIGPPAGTPSRPSRWDVLLATLVVGFAFLAASFPARNSDLWLHLAAGRLLASGGYVFGHDPFAYTTGGVYWANHAWLSDLALYLGYQTLGGAGLVALKAAGVALLAALLLRISRGAGPFWVAGGCVLLAVLAMSPRLLLQPACASLVLLAVCLWLLTLGGRALYFLPAVVALWVNVDEWFLLGPLTVALFAGGQLLAATNSPRVPAWLVPACLVACLFSPHHYHALTLPDALSPTVWASGLRHDVRFAPLFASPWRWEPLARVHLAAWAFFVLLALCLFSFGVNRPARRSGRLPVVLGFTLLAVWQVRLVPFFAVVAGPITALNLREVLAARPFTTLGRSAVLVASLALILLAGPGWLQGFQRRDRALGWDIVPDPSLKRLAETLTRWRREGALPEGARTFAVHPEAAHYFAWFAPGEKSFLDGRLRLFVPVADDYLRVCRAVGIGGRKGSAVGTDSPSEGEGVLRAYDIVGVVVYDPDLRRLGPALKTVSRSPDHWEILRIDGKALFVGGAGRSLTPGLPSFDAGQAAFAPGEDEALPPAPGNGPAALARPRVWWDAYLERPGGSSWEADAAAIYLRLFGEEAGRQLARQQVAVRARHMAGLVGCLAGGGSPGGVASGLLDRVFSPDLGRREAALPLLAVRAARRAVAADPTDANAWFVLGNAYLALDRTTAEAFPQGQGPGSGLLAEVRYVQTVTALVQAVILEPDLAAGHGILARLFQERGYLDLALRHRRAELELARRAGPLPGEDGEAFAGRLEGLEEALREIEATVMTAENRFVVHSDTLAADPLARARLAVSLGLAGKALDEVLLRSHPDLYGIEGLRLLLELLLRTGRAADARDLLDREELQGNPDSLGAYDLPGRSRDGRHWTYRFPACVWFDLCQAAAAGDYNRASGVLQALRERLKQGAGPLRDRLVPALAGRLTAEVGMGAAPEAILYRLFVRLDRDPLVGLLGQSQFIPVERADLHVLEGMLLLERGLPARAGEHFGLALETYRRAADTVAALPGLPLALHYRARVRRFER